MCVCDVYTYPSLYVLRLLSLLLMFIFPVCDFNFYREFLTHRDFESSIVESIECYECSLYFSTLLICNFCLWKTMGNQTSWDFLLSKSHWGYSVGLWLLIFFSYIVTHVSFVTAVPALLRSLLSKLIVFMDSF